jgi:uncharacterized protein (TIGR00369 family)
MSTLNPMACDLPANTALKIVAANAENCEATALAEIPNPMGFEIPFVNWVGLEMGFYEGGKSLLKLQPKAHHMNSLGMVHGGVVMTMLDVGMATAARSAAKTEADSSEPRVITIEMKTSFMKPSTGLLEVHGKVLSHSRSMAFCEAEIIDPLGRVCAKGSGTFKYVRLPKS